MKLLDRLLQALRGPVSDDLPTPSLGIGSGENVPYDPRHDPESYWCSQYIPEYPFGMNSNLVKLTLCPELRYIVNYVADRMDISLVSGYRGRIEQNRLYDEGVGLAYPTSYHNSYPSHAVDMIPYPTGYKDLYLMGKMMTLAQQAAEEIGVEVTEGHFFSNVQDSSHLQVELP